MPFENMPLSARTWIYQSVAPFPPEQKTFIGESLKTWCEQWSAHGSPLRSSFAILHDHFIVLAVDESLNAASGCSIDTSVEAIRSISRETGKDLFNREQIAFLGEGIFFVSLKDLRTEFRKGSWNEHTITFNNSVVNLGEMQSAWMKPAGETWLRRYIVPETITG